MRIRLLVMLGFIALLAGGTCIPLVKTASRQPAAGDTLGIALLMPDTDRTVGEGTIVSVEWTASNLTGESATITVTAESRVDLVRTTLLDHQALDGEGGSGTVNWNTDGFSGFYVLYAEIAAGDQTQEASSPGGITVRTRPTFEFTAPLSDAEYQLGSSTPLTIAWKGSASSATSSVLLDTDADPNNGNEVTIADPNLGSTSAAGSIDWLGQDTSSADVPTGVYNLVGMVNDSANPILYTYAPGRITVLAAEPNEPEIIEPSGDTTFLTTDPNALSIVYKIHNKKSNVYVDIKLDPDDTRTDGNELTILSQQLVRAGVDPNAFSWTGNDSSGAAVPVGIYRLYLAISQGTGTPTTVDGTGFIFRRSAEKQPLIALLTPTSVTNVDPGDYVSITWRDDDPAANAKIRIVIANTAVAADHVNDPNALEILSGRLATETGTEDAYSWQVPSSSGLTPSTTYYIIAYIQNDDADKLNSSSVAAGRVILNDPTAR